MQTDTMVFNVATFQRSSLTAVLAQPSDSVFKCTSLGNPGGVSMSAKLSKIDKITLHPDLAAFAWYQARVLKIMQEMKR